MNLVKGFMSFKETKTWWLTDYDQAQDPFGEYLQKWSPSSLKPEPGEKGHG